MGYGQPTAGEVAMTTLWQVPAQVGQRVRLMTRFGVVTKTEDTSPRLQHGVPTITIKADDGGELTIPTVKHFTQRIVVIENDGQEWADL